MKLVIVLMTLTAMVMSDSDPIMYYEGLLETVDLEKMVTSPETLKKYSDCFLDRGDCDELGAKIKKVIPESVETACLKCTAQQKHATRRYFEELVKQYPIDLGAFSEKYDPEFKYFYKFLEAVKEA